jgi:hypothetical protein
MTGPASPARVAIPPMKERRSLEAGPDSRFGFFDMAPASDLNLSNGAILDALWFPLRLFLLSITEIVYLSMKIVKTPNLETPNIDNS